MEGDGNEPNFTIGDLSALTDLSRRTIRFYIEKGLLLPPEGAGRGARYTRDHLKQLRRIVEGREQNLTLEEVAHLSAHAPRRTREDSIDPDHETWSRFTLARGVELHLLESEYSDQEKRALEHVLTTTLKKLRVGR